MKYQMFPSKQRNIAGTNIIQPITKIKTFATIVKFYFSVWCIRLLLQSLIRELFADFEVKAICSQNFF